MNYTPVTGSIWDDGYDLALIPVNCLGFMGGGIARQCADRYPDIEARYVAACKDHEMPFRPGRLLFYRRPDVGSDENPRFVCLIPTMSYGMAGDYSVIMAGLRKLVQDLNDDVYFGAGPGRHVYTIAVPPLGCGIGGLRWSNVREMIENYLGKLDPGEFKVCVFEPQEGGS